MPKREEDGKQQINFRLTTEAVELMDAIARLDGIPRTSVLEIAIRRYAESRGVRKTAGE